MYICDIYQSSLKFYCQRFSNNATPIFTDQELLTVYLFCGAYQRYFQIKEIHTSTEEYLLSWFPNLPSYQTFNYHLTIYNYLMFTCHPLPNIHQYGIFSCFRHLYLRLKSVDAARLFLVAFGGGDIDGDCLAFYRLQSLRLRGGIELRETVVVPQQSIAFVRQYERDGNLGVHLSEPKRETTHIDISVLKLSRAEEIFVCGREESLSDSSGCFALHLRFFHRSSVGA